MTFRVRRLPGLSLAMLSGVACGGGRDVVPESRDVVGAASSASSESNAAEGYEYTVRRPLAVVALAEARGLPPDVARMAIDHLADSLDSCLMEEARKGWTIDGAARVIAQIDASGNVAATSVRLDPGKGQAESAVLCLVAPVKLLTFPPAASAMRGMAIEAIWGKGLPSTIAH